MLTTTPYSQFRISQYTHSVLSLNPTEDDLAYLFEIGGFSIELEEYLFEKMDNCPTDKSYLELVQEELSKLDLLVG